MKIDLDALERIAKAAHDGRESSVNAYLAATQPMMTLSLVWRIRELEQILGETIADVGPSFADDPLYDRIEDVLGKGATR